MNLKVPGAILPLGCAILSNRAKTVRGVVQPSLGELGLISNLLPNLDNKHAVDNQPLDSLRNIKILYKLV